MTYTTNKAYSLIPPHGGYRKLASYQSATIAFDFGAAFADRYISGNKTNKIYGSYRSYDQLFQALRSGRQNYETYKTYLHSGEAAANCLICLIRQTNYLLDRQLAALEKQFLEEGGFTERLYNMRRSQRSGA